ncbi:MAG: cytochrome c peroxidase [Pseudomonadota bacterium]
MRRFERRAAPRALAGWRFAIALAAVAAFLPHAAAAPLSAAASLGRRLFFDASLSASGKLSCASCHDPRHAHAPGNGLAVQLGGPALDRPGLRAVPSLRYLDQNGALSVHADGSAIGGFDWDGRAPSLAAQAAGPLLAPNEMANANPAEVVARLRRAPYAAQFRRVFGAGILRRPDAAFARLTFALQQYQIESPAFHPYDSKFDSVLTGRARLTPAEARGRRLFDDKDKGNCAACHSSAPGPGGRRPLFTDFSYDSTGVPRNMAIPANAQDSHFDLGLCGTEAIRQPGLCGKFRVPTLRNVATRRVFFHNGVFTSLREVLEFYARRDTEPQRWYPPDARGELQIFNDLPPALRANVNRTEVPYDRKPGMVPALDAADIDDLLRFLATLNDGYRPAPRGASRQK